MVETSFRAGISYRTRKGGNHVSGMPSLWVAAQVSEPHLSECHRWRAVSAKGSKWLVRVTEARGSRPGGSCFPSISSPSCMVHTREPSGPTSNSSGSSHLGTPRSQYRDQEPPQSAGQPHTLLQTPFTLPECTVSPPLPFSPLLGCMHCLYCTEKGRDSRSEEERMERGQAQHPPSQPRPTA